MTDKKIRRLSKTELLWIIHDQEEEILELKEQLAALTERLKEVPEEILLDNHNEQDSIAETEDDVHDERGTSDPRTD